MNQLLKLYCFVQTLVVSAPRPSQPGRGSSTTNFYPHHTAPQPVTLPPIQPTPSSLAGSLSDMNLSSNRYLRRADDENKSFNESGTQTTHGSSEEDRNTSPPDEDDDDPITDGRRIVGQVRVALVV